MLEKLLGVSPPQKGDAQGIKDEVKQSLKGASESQYKNDFETALKKKMNSKLKDQESSKPDSESQVSSQKNADSSDLGLKEKTQKNVDEPRATGKEKEESSGGIKKKMTKSQNSDELVSMIMASNENEVETPISKIETAEAQDISIQDKPKREVPSWLDQPKVMNAQLNAQQAMTAENQLSAQRASEQVTLSKDGGLQEASQSFSGQQPEAQSAFVETKPEVEGQALFGLKEGVQSHKASALTSAVDSAAMPQMRLLQDMHHQMAAAAQNAISMDLTSVASEATSPLSTAIESQPVVASLAATVAAPYAIDAEERLAPQAMVASSGRHEVREEFDLEQDLKDAVNFESEKPQASFKSQLVSFEASKNLTGEKVSAFEKAVFEQLSKMSQQSHSGLPLMGLHNKEKISESATLTDESELNSSTLNREGRPEGSGISSASLGETALAKNSFANGTGIATSKALTGAPVLVHAEDRHNVQQIINQSQYLIKKGGGEMNVKMSPEGLGDVHLRVILNDGHVEIQMQTQDHQVKKMIEESLSELKSSLATHRLSVDHVRIDTVGSMQTDNSSQFQSNSQTPSHAENRHDWNQAGHQEKQREFWQQFQDNMNHQSGRRSGYGEAGVNTVSDMASGRSAQDGQSAKLASLRTYGGTKGATVNRVA